MRSACEPSSGAAPAPSASIDPREFANPPGFHAGEGGARAGSGGAAPLRGFVDVRDELVYAMALARFELDMRAALGRPKPPWASDVDSGAGF